ncbi:hypothetical protein QR680_000520 [Steinernema hermaphroditum]|uniref:Uncharacterized protein n=1 Tax=Steinernema hermaphroditum TaxID=289476 RepID=A0AA39GUW3_9BILA|nr:hypothetical protein QR680_000520 [Steinernema hermaphroditum]
METATMKMTMNLKDKKSQLSSFDKDIEKSKGGFVDMNKYIGEMYRPKDYPELNGKEPDWVASECKL